MAVLSREQMLERIKQRIGEDTSDEALKLIEDISDTISIGSTITVNTPAITKQLKVISVAHSELSLPHLIAAPKLAGKNPPITPNMVIITPVIELTNKIANTL